MNIPNTNIYSYIHSMESSADMCFAQGVVLPAVLAILCTQLAILIDIRWGWRGILRRMRSLALCSTRVAPTDLVLLEVTVPAPHTPHQLRVAPPPDKQVPLIAN